MDWRTANEIGEDWALEAYRATEARRALTDAEVDALIDDVLEAKFAGDVS